MNPPAIQTVGLEKVYETGERSVHALAGVDLRVGDGEFLCVAGPSGSGKSTLLHVLAGLVRPTRGRVEIAGVAIHELPDAEAARFRRRHIGLIFQFFNLVPTLNVEENIALVRLLEGRRLADLREQIEPLVGFLGLAGRLDHHPSRLSGGEMQRVAIARALFADARLLLADEPTGNLDSKSGEAILSHLRRVCDDRGVTTVIVTHDLRAASYADRVVVIRDGQIADDVPANRAAARLGW